MFSKIAINTVTKSTNIKKINLKNLQKIQEDYYTMMSIAHANGFKISDIKMILNKTKTKHLYP